MSENQSKIIEITAVETKMFDNGGTQYKIKASDGKSYKFNDNTKPDEEGRSRPTVAYKQFKDMGLKVGSTVDIWFKEVQKEYEGKPYTDRLIASFRETTGKPMEKPTLQVTEPTYQKEEVKDDKFWDKKAYKQCLWGYWLDKYATKAFEARSADGIMGQAEMDLVWQVFNQIEQDANKRFDELNSIADSVPF